MRSVFKKYRSNEQTRNMNYKITLAIICPNHARYRVRFRRPPRGNHMICQSSGHATDNDNCNGIRLEVVVGYKLLTNLD